MPMTAVYQDKFDNMLFNTHKMLPIATEMLPSVTELLPK